MRGASVVGPWLGLVGLCGCFTAPAHFDAERRSIEAESGLRLTSQTSIHLGSSALWLTRALGDVKAGSGLLEHVDRVEVATFEVEGGQSRRAVEAFRAGPSWACLLRAREKGSSARIFLEFASDDSESSSRLLVVASDEKALVLVRLEGSLAGLLEGVFSGKAASPVALGALEGPLVWK